MDQRSQIGFVSYPKGEFHTITNDTNGYVGVSPSADGKTLVTVLSDENRRVSIVPADFSSPGTDLTSRQSTWSAVWTPDAKLLLDLDYSIVVVDPATGQKTTLQTSTAVNYFSSPSLCNDGKTVVMSGGAFTVGIFRMDAGGGNLKRLSSGKRDMGATCSPDSKSASYLSFGDTGLIQHVPFEGGTPEVVSKIPNWGGGFDFSPDGKLIAFVGLVKPAPEYLIKLLVINAESGQIVQSFESDVTSGFNHLRFTRDGKAILFAKHESAGDSLWLQSLDQSPARQLGPAFKSDLIWDMSYSPDGKKLAVVRGHTDSDVVMLSTNQQQ